MVQEVTGIRVLSLHHDISTTTGEEVVLFTLAQIPVFREMKKG
ncbi:MAG: Na-translocating system protein MpsC family protein [Gemmatimonadota bacterium]